MTSAGCCGYEGDSFGRAVLWVCTLGDEAIADLFAETEIPAMTWATRPEHAEPPPTPMHREVLRSAFCGDGLRLVVEGCNRRWPRPAPTAALICAVCGRGRRLGSPPRGWPSGRRRWHRWLADRGIDIGRYVTTTTVYDGMAVFIADDRH